MRRTRVHPNATRSTKLRGTQRSPENAFRTTEFRVPENLIFLSSVCIYIYIYICVCVCVFVCMYVCIYVYWRNSCYVISVTRAD